MHDLVLDFLEASVRSVEYRQPLMTELAALFSVSAKELYYLKAQRPHAKMGTLPDGQWRFYFHGDECDLMNTADRRFLRIDFGPRGETAAFTAWGVAQFIMASKPPWVTFERLQAHLAKGGPPYDAFSASLERVGALCDEVEKRGWIETAAPDLLELEKRFSKRDEHGIAVLRLPPGTPDHVYSDISVANRKITSAKGSAILQKQRENQKGHS